MSKKVATLPNWFWPEGVARSIGIPPLFLDELLVERWADETPQKVAFITQSEEYTYQRLREVVNRGARNIDELCRSNGNRVLIVEESPATSLLLLLSAWKARCFVCLLHPEQISLASRFAPNVVISSAHKPHDNVAITQPEAIFTESADQPIEGRCELRHRSVAMPSIDGFLVFHSHYSLAAGILALVTFLEIPQQLRVVVANHPTTWHGLYSALLAMYQGGTAIVNATSSAQSLVQNMLNFDGEALFVTPEQAGELISEVGPRQRRELREKAKWVVMAIESAFSARVRESLRNLFRRPITNVELRPVDPKSREPIEVPWELLEYAGVEIKASHLMVEYDDPKITSQRLRRRWFFNGLLAMMDANGLYYLLD